MLSRVIARLQQWNLFDDEEISLAAKSLTILTKTCALVNLISEANLTKLFQLFLSEDLPIDVKLALAESFCQIS